MADDWAELRRWAAAEGPRGGVFGARGDVQVAVAVGGLVVHPGDAVVGDENGVVVVPADRLVEVLAAVPAALERDREVQARWTEHRGADPT